MVTSNRRPAVLAKHRSDILWGAWVELGVSGWQRTHASWAVDPEPLIIATACLGDADPRLRDEALDWCIHYGRYVSKVRLRNLLRDQPDDVRRGWGPFAATVSKHSGTQWPLTTEAFPYKPTGRASLGSLIAPSLVWLRLRAMFGLGARTEILRYFLSDHRRATVAAIAEQVGYAKRNVAEECDSLEKAGVLKVQHVANRFYYLLDRRVELRDWVGEIAPVRPDWTSLLHVTFALVALEESAKSLSQDALSIEAHRVARHLDDVLDALDIEERPRLVDRDNHWPAVRDFAEQRMAAWATGAWEPTNAPVEIKRRRVARQPLTTVDPSR